MATFTKIVEGSENNPKDYCHSYDQITRSNVSPGLKPSTIYIPLFHQNEMILTNLETSINVSSKLIQPRAEYMDLTEIRTDKNKTQSGDQGADDAALHRQHAPGKWKGITWE